jgi:hypothetical protein
LNRGYAVRSIEVTRTDHPTTRQNQPIQIDERTSRRNLADHQRSPSPPAHPPPAKTLAKINSWRVSGLPWPHPREAREAAAAEAGTIAESDEISLRNP